MNDLARKVSVKRSPMKIKTPPRKQSVMSRGLRKRESAFVSTAG